MALFVAGGTSNTEAASGPDLGRLTRGPANPILRNSSPYDDAKVGPSTVVKVAASDYRQWYEAIDNENRPAAGDLLSQTAYATSSDGTNWVKRGVVFSPLAAPSWENSEACPTSMHWDGSKWILFYHGGNNSKPRAIGRASSSTGTGSFTRDATGPILQRGGPGTWDEKFVADAKVVPPWEGPDNVWRMYYVGRNAAGKGQVGLATSTNGISFIKVGSAPVLALGPSGAWDDGDIQAFAVEWDRAANVFRAWYVAKRSSDVWSSIGYAWSSNGVSWNRGTQNPVLTSVSGDNVADSVDAYLDGSRYRTVYGQYDLAASPPLRGKGEASIAVDVGTSPPPPPPSSGTTATFSVTTNSDDGAVERGAATYPPTSSTPGYVDTTTTSVLLRRSKTPYSYQPVRVGLIRFDTSALPDDAVVQSAELRVNVIEKTSADGRSLVAEWYPGGAWPIDLGDWTNTDSSSAHTGTSINSLPTGPATLSLANLGSISLTGTTALRLHVSGAGTAPTGANDVSFAAQDHPTLAEPQLVVRYERAAPVSVSIPVASSTDDGDVERGSATYPPSANAPAYVDTTATSVVVRRTKTPYSYQPVRVSLLRFNTSSLPDNAVITSAALSLQIIAKTSVDSRSLVAEWYPGGAWPIDAADWTNTDSGSAHIGTSISAIPVGPATFTLGNLGSISLTGVTALRLHISAAGAAPTGTNDLSFAAYDHATLREPELLVTYRTG